MSKAVPLGGCFKEPNIGGFMSCSQRNERGTQPVVTCKETIPAHADHSPTT